jgi:hypothetical protein
MAMEPRDKVRFMKVLLRVRISPPTTDTYPFTKTHPQRVAEKEKSHHVTAGGVASSPFSTLEVGRDGKNRILDRRRTISGGNRIGTMLSARTGPGSPVHHPNSTVRQKAPFRSAIMAEIN